MQTLVEKNKNVADNGAFSIKDFLPSTDVCALLLEYNFTVPSVRMELHRMLLPCHVCYHTLAGQESGEGTFSGKIA